jgi:threonine aldolase
MTPFRVDLRSDTVTAPSPAMRAAMAEAEVGDAWYGSDPTVNRLQELAAERLGTEAALYVPTGTMGNQIALRLHVQGSGHLVASSSAAHVATTEVMTSAVLSGIAFRTVDPGPRGWIDAAQAEALLEPDSYYEVEEVDLLAVENTAVL